jgi:predicted dehydrogenase
MVGRAEEEGITLATHHLIRYAGLVPALHRMFAEYHLGEPVAVVVEGGAACLLTNGLHWIDFAIELFNSEPQSVISTAYGEPINPRSSDLMIYGGTAVWSFGDRREAIITFNNRSSLALRALVYLRDAVVELDGVLNTVLRLRDPTAVAQFPAITRTGPASELIFEGLPPGVLEYMDGIRAAIQNVQQGGAVTSSGAVGATAVSACIGALVSSRERQRIDLPIDPVSSVAQEQWPIS